MAQMRNESNPHPNHPVRNFFYILWLLVVSVAFLALWVGISLFAETLGKILAAGGAAILLLGVVVGIIVPAAKQRKFRKWQKRHG
jgi:membrane protein YdbS with pleckstrin-like domain